MARTGTRYTEEQIIGILKEADAAGASIGEVIRRHGISPKTYYRWKAKYVGMEVPDARRLRHLESENRKLKHVVAELTLDNRTLKELLGKPS